MKCPNCLHEMAWQSDAMHSDRTGEETTDDEDRIISFWTCPHCGADVEYMECAPIDQQNYPFWDDRTNSNP